jgi:large subunit ribosomal protein L29
MEIDEIRNMTGDEIQEELNASHRELMNLRFRTSTMQLANVNEIGKTKKRIARINTVIRERELARA